MKKLYSLMLALVCFGYATFSQTLIPVGDELILPQYAYFGGIGPGVANRIPFVCRLKLTGLLPSATYRYMTGMSSTNNLTTAQAPGNMYRINNGSNTAGFITGFAVTKAINSSEINNDELRTDNTSRHGRFATDASGNYTGWFACALIGNTTQQVNGSDVFFYLNLNDGGAGLTLAQSYRTTSTVKLLNYSSVAGNAAGCTPLLGTSDVGGERMVTIYDNVASTGRPLYCTFTENNNSIGALNEATIWTNPQIYGFVDGVSGSWAAIVPNSLSGGVKAINFLDVATGTPITLSNSPTPNTSSDGVWNGVATANPAGDSTLPIKINSIFTPSLPIKLLSFEGKVTSDGIQLSWSTAQETNNKHFELRRAGKDGQFVTIATIAGKVSSQVNSFYNYADRKPFAGINYYQLRQVDLDGNTTTFKTVALKFGAAPRQLQIISSSRNELVVSVTLNEAVKGSILFTDLTGRILYNQNASLLAGENVIKIPVQQISQQPGVVSFISANERMTIKVLR